MNKFFLLIFLIVLCFYIGCKDDPKTIPTPIPIEVEDEWPNFVDTGANMLAYKVDGKIRVAKNISKLDSTSGFLSCGYLFKNEYKLFFFHADRISDEKFESIWIDIGDMPETGIYKLGGNSFFFNNGSYFGGPEEVIAKQYSTTDLDSGILNITKIDTIKGFITGTFEFDAEYAFGTNKVKITEGRFDLKYYR